MRLLYYDHRANGRSGRPPLETLTFEHQCADADALREHLGFEEIAVLGFSYGGFVALEYALRYPQRLKRLILVDTAATFDYAEEIEANARGKGATQEQLDALEAEVTDEATFRQQIETLLPLYWRRFDVDLGERILSSTVLSAEAAEAGFA